MTGDSSVPPLPKFELARYVARKQAIAETLAMLPGSVLTEETRKGVAQNLATILSVSKEAAWGSLLGLVGGKQVSVKDVGQLATRLAGNITRLKSGKASLPWSAQERLEWSVCQFVDAEDYITRSGKRGLLFRVCYLTGNPAGETVSKFFSSKYCYHAGRALGFTRRRPMDSPRQLVLNLAFALVEPDLSVERGFPAFSQLAASPSMREHNTRLYDSRDLEKRRDRPANCPQRLKCPCFRCPIGYEGDNSCAKAARQQSLQQGVCVECGSRTFVKVYSRIKGAECLRCRLRFLGAKTR